MTDPTKTAEQPPTAAPKDPPPMTDDEATAILIRAAKIEAPRWAGEERMKIEQAISMAEDKLPKPADAPTTEAASASKK